MTNPIITIHNAETGEIVEREMTDQELAQREEDKVQAEARSAVEAAKAAEKVAVLAKLGLTADEVAALLS